MATSKDTFDETKTTHDLVEMTNSRIEVLTGLIREIQAKGITRGPSERSLRRTRSLTTTSFKEKEKDKEETLDSVQIGDIVYLDHEETKSILTGDRVAIRCGMQEQGSREV